MAQQSYNEWLFEQWAPPGGPWTPWAKPVLFSQMDAGLQAAVPEQPWQSPPVQWAPPPGQRVAVVVDLPGVEAVQLSLALAAQGYRPVPLFNCCVGAFPVLEMRPVVEALQHGGQVLKQFQLPDDAPPAFILDARRSKGDSPVMPGRFDNRWVVLPQDFPSGALLRSRGIERAILVQDVDGQQPRSDLAHVLRRWQERGLRISAVGAGMNAHPIEIEVAKPSWFRYAWYAVAATIGLRRNSAGGFGSRIPVPSAG